MMTAFRDGALIAGVVGISLAVAGGSLAPRQAYAEDAFGSAIDTDELAVIRGGDNDTTTNSHNNTAVAGSEQNATANNDHNSIAGDSTAGNFTVGAGAIANNRGMTNVVVNTAPQSNTQGIMTLNLVLQ